mgnify:CR=1 FL=1
MDHQKTNPKKAILTNLHVDLDYFDLKRSLPKNSKFVVPGYPRPRRPGAPSGSPGSVEVGINNNDFKIIEKMKR